MDGLFRHKTHPDLMPMAVEYLKAHEGVVNHMYLDVVGLVTIGVGFMIPTHFAADNLDVVRRVDGVPATTEEKADEWRAIRALKEGRQAKWYKQFTKLEMQGPDIDLMLARLLHNFYLDLSMRFKGIREFPLPVGLGLLDMAYSLGTTGLLSKYPKFCDAVRRHDWAACADECERRNVSKSRNEALAELFRSTV